MQDFWRDFKSMLNSKTTEWISLTSIYFHKHYHTSTGDWYKYFMWGKDITLAGICGGKKWKKKCWKKENIALTFFRKGNQLFSNVMYMYFILDAFCVTYLTS